MRRYLRYLAVGIEFAVVLTLFLLGGLWLDGKFEHLAPLFTIVGCALGLTLAIWSLIRQVDSGR